ncbi:MAG TPA: DNA-directed RNA polymerase subunit alpha [Acetomicrobium flavidum]|uniref:DNA-directed RNA polymerase subunit alpha n=1 Tax=Acetomicrobium flavidum TaxID=49896 RepID=UPI002CCBB9C3|nr:DNA-directed RNA polymerase subunit alpha [Acetomicrobium flavidum]HPP14401.1 DNA-directed RNA polymerase subunit alpha [Acetomicrobium flavidum]
MERVVPDINVEECTSGYGRIRIEPLDRGYGVTLGNAIRRVLLSSIPGAAVSAIRIDGVLHEFSTVPGVMEDVLEIILNIKKLAVVSHSDEVRVLRLEAQGPKEVTAADIAPDSEIEFPNPDAYICTLEEGHKLGMDLYVERGVGYLTMDRPRPSYLPVDVLLIDAIFSPVLRVNYSIGAARVGQRTDYESLLLELWTNETVTPIKAFLEAIKILNQYFSHIASLLLKEPKVPQEVEVLQAPVEVKVEEDPLLARPIRDLELSIRSENCLLRAGIRTIGDLIQYSRDDLLKIRNLGKISLKEIEEKLQAFGLSLSSSKISAKKEKGQEDDEEYDLDENDDKEE